MMIIRKLVFAMTISFMAVSCTGQSSQSMENKNVDEVVELEKEKDVLLIDVRTPGEVASGYLKGTDYFFDISNRDFEKNIEGLDKNKTYVVICHSGARSSKAANYMLKNGFTRVINMSGGMRVVKNNAYITK
ncbi:MAG: rhodanese-like domain-containing protein [Cryomorphaceae bacterium]|nr:rhodanese-like domain-containing protein [Cryomorphaceae bacterium]